MVADSRKIFESGFANPTLAEPQVPSTRRHLGTRLKQNFVALMELAKMFDVTEVCARKTWNYVE